MKTQKILFLILGAVLVFFLSCSDSDKKNEEKIPEYDPNKELSISGFIPDSGGIAEQFVLYGANFGGDISKIKLFFNEKPAAIISSKGDKLLALAPRLPGDTCEITLQIGDQTVIANKTFKYIPQMTVSSVAGSPGANGGNFAAGSLAEASFANIRNVVADSYGNIFVSQYGAGTSTLPGATNGISKIDLHNNNVSWVTDVTGGATAWNNPTINHEDDAIYYPANSAGAILEINPVDFWTPRFRRLKSPIESDDKPQWTTWSTTHSLAWHPSGVMYTRDYYGVMAVIDPKTWIAEIIGGRGVALDPLVKSDSYVAINPLDPQWLYISYVSFHKIRRFHLEKHIFEDFVGAGGTGGWKDGIGSDAKFNGPRAICFDSEGIMYVADYANQCIRRVAPDKTVSTLAGIPTKSGYKDGRPMEAQFNNPWGICTDKDNNIYVCDASNRVVRKITLE